MGVAELIEKDGIEATFNKARELARNYVYDLRSKGQISFSDPEEGSLPSVHVISETLPEAWEKMTMAIIGIGQLRHTHYDPGHKTGKYESFPSMEVTGNIHLKKPLGEPFFHQHSIGGWMGWGDYHAEMEGVKDHWVMNPGIVVDLLKQGGFEEIKDHTGWLYSYSQRFRNYPFIDINAKPQTINQLQQVIENLSREPSSRSAQIVTWDPRWDHNNGQMKYREAYPNGDIKSAVFKEYHAPCLQSLWFRLEDLGEGFGLNVNGRFRSHCHAKGLPPNFYGIYKGIVEPIRRDLEQALEKPIVLKRFHNTSDSLHVYGHYLDPRMQGKDAEAYLEDVWRISSGEPIEKRIVIPGSPMHEVYLEEIEKEYQERKANPNKDRGSI